MGKNQTHKMSQMSKHSSRGDGEAGGGDGAYGVDVSYHTAEWHAARLAALTVERPSWEDYIKKQKDEAEKERVAMEEQDRAMLEYKSGLEADRAARLGHAPKDAGVKKERREKDKKRKHSSKDKKKKHKKEKKHKRDKKKRRRSSSGSSSSGSDSGSSSGSDGSGDERRAAKKSKDKDKEGGMKHVRSGPIKLSEYLNG